MSTAKEDAEHNCIVQGDASLLETASYLCCISLAIRIYIAQQVILTQIRVCLCTALVQRQPWIIRPGTDYVRPLLLLQLLHLPAALRSQGDMLCSLPAGQLPVT